jgi:Protein of unknown function (DUF4245)
MGCVSEHEGEPSSRTAVSVAPPSPEQPSRYSRTTNGLLASLIVTVLAVGAFVGFREAFRDQPSIERGAVDYLGTVEDAQAGGLELVYPASLPEGWDVTHIDFVPGARPAWGVGMLTEDGRYVGLRQEDADVDDLLEAYVDENAEPGDETGFDSGLTTGPWQLWADAGGDLAYSTELTGGGEGVVGDTILVYGSASRDDQEKLISLLTTAEVD